ncbi:hypothetical protein JW805_02185 [Roseomonas aeriglobus]|nr:hypothetical protein [Roseomonas aeriglobus]
MRFRDLFKSQIEDPKFKRAEISGAGEDCLIEIWDPVQTDDGWGCRCSFRVGEKQKVMVMPGSDALSALLHAVHSISDISEQEIGTKNLKNMKKFRLPKILFDQLP